MGKLGIIGYPLAHTLSPAMHTAALRQLGLEDMEYTKLECSYRELGEMLAKIRDEFTGVNVTIPYKEKVLPWMDEVTYEARMAGAVNTISVRDGRLVGTNTDGTGFLRSLRERGIELAGKRVLVLGSGGASRGVTTALVGAKVETIHVSSRRKAQGTDLMRILQTVGAQDVRWQNLGRVASLPVETYDLIVQTTPVGMHPHETECISFPFERIGPDQIVYDLIYRPLETLFLRSAAEQGARTVNGLDMLLYQGAASLECWLDRDAPIEAMRRALQEALDHA